MKKQNQLSFQAVMYWVVGSCLLTCMQTAAKWAGQFGFSIRQCMWVRYLGGLLLSLAILWMTKRSMRAIRSANWRLQAQRSAAVAVITFGLFTANKLIGLGLTTAFAYSWPAFSLVVGWQRWLGFKEKPDFRSVVSVLLTFIGVGMLANARVALITSSSDLVVMLLGSGAVLLASICSGYQANIAQKISRVDSEPLTGLVWLSLVGVAVLGLWSIGAWVFPVPSDPLPEMTVTSIAVVLAVAVCGTVAQYLYILAQAKAPAKSLTPLTSIFQLPFALVVGHFAFGESWPSFEEGIWMIVIIVSGLLNYLPTSGFRKPPAKPLGAS